MIKSTHGKQLRATSVFLFSSLFSVSFFFPAGIYLQCVCKECLSGVDGMLPAVRVILMCMFAVHHRRRRFHVCMANPFVYMKEAEEVLRFLYCNMVTNKYHVPASPRCSSSRALRCERGTRPVQLHAAWRSFLPGSTCQRDGDGSARGHLEATLFFCYVIIYLLKAGQTRSLIRHME